MNRKSLAVAVVLFAICVPVLASAQEKQQKSTPPTTQSTAKQSERTADTVTMNRGELIALQNDVKQMRVILRQMQNNLGAATSAQDPMKHQFELEIEMWQIVIDQMERRIKAAGGQ